MVRISAERPKNIRNYVFFINSEMWSLGQGGELTPSPVQLSPSPLGGSTRTVHTRTLYIILTHAAFWAFRFSAFQSFFCSSSLCFPHFFFFFFGTATFPSWLQGLITLFSLDGVGGDGDEDGDRESCVA